MGLEVPNRKLSSQKIELNTFKRKYSNLDLPEFFTLDEFKELDNFLSVRDWNYAVPINNRKIDIKISI